MKRIQFSQQNQVSRTLGRMLLPLLLGIFFLPASAFSKETVRCKYLQSQGQNIRLEVSVQFPPPGSLIVIQQVPVGINIEHATPPIKKFNKQNGEAKWLFKGIKPGTFVIEMALDKPIGAGTIKGEVRYMDPVSGAMIKMPITP